MTTEKRLTSLGRIAERTSQATDAASTARDKFKETGGETRANRLGYHEGQASAYNEAHKVMKAELQRLRNLLQNGSLTQADFGDDLPY